ncbi:inter-alpha-trypsin inhibitor heavy chain H5 [Denticeps clupeoides]|uniref:Inter-alpha-trypsin inhibitor heavy chain H5 n=1 Tax=Denticeps clupeoides TaxID=299321 RepID=A0AAY4E146_9TELE|nr:inter-alpha-trypsin inhibitor heavy chain H5 [Denticeps clupeoides]
MARNTLLCALIVYFGSHVSAAHVGDPDLDLDPDLDDFFSDSDREIVPRRSARQVKTSLAKETKPHIQELSVKTTIISRYAFTAVSCTMFNRYSVATEGVFQFQVPATAYVSNFTMIVGGRVYPSQIRPREKRLKHVKEDDSKLKTKGSTENSESEMEMFRMAVVVPGKNRAIFLLTYEELLQRRLGHYEHVTSVRPMQLVSRLRVETIIVDHSPITHLEVLPLRNGKTAPSPTPDAKATVPLSTVIQQNRTFCKITFSPNIAQQARITTSGNLGDFIIRYDVEREMGIGDIQVLDGHFVHYFAPKDLPVVPKNVVFVIDASASMLGTKIRQTKEALFTILKDLRPHDHFNFVAFSNRIRIWQPGKLVPVTPDNIRDAKKFIFSISPTGGTDINGAIQSGSTLLRTFLSSAEGDNSVSLIIFLTDGRPTVGEMQTSSILGNTQGAVQELFCIFTIGLGNDVDYRLLERMALENCGTMRRIGEDADARSMLKGFYDEIGTPLLSDIHVEYSDGSVDYVTQHVFTNYFNGSEIVIAGKLTNQSSDSLHVMMTASNSDRTLVLETDVRLPECEQETERRVAAVSVGVSDTGPSADGYVERLWGFLSVKDGLRSRLRSQTSRERDGFTQQVTNISLAYNFLTPLTNMLVEKPQGLPDGTLDNNAKSTAAPVMPSSNELPDEAAGVSPQSLTRKKEQPSSEVIKERSGTVRRPSKKSVTISKTSADGDPHFVVEFPLSKLTVCFNINGEPGDVLRLVTDHTQSGVTVNGKLIGAPAPAGSRKDKRTYFSSIIIVVDKPRRAYIEVTPRKIILDSRDRMVLPSDSSIAVESGGLAVAIAARSNITVTIQGTIGFVILLHLYKNPAPYQTDHLGFYISNSKGLSEDSHGLLGQFLNENVSLTELPANVTSSKPKGPQKDVQLRQSVLKIKDRTVPVVKKSRRIYSGRQTVDCWFARNNAAKLIEGEYRNYVVPHMFYMGDWPHGTNTD